MAAPTVSWWVGVAREDWRSAIAVRQAATSARVAHGIHVRRFTTNGTPAAERGPRALSGIWNATRWPKR